MGVERVKRFLWISFGFAVLCLLAAVFIPTPSLQTRLTACDVGQGDAILIQHGNWNMVIDTGPDSAVLRCLSEKLPFWRRTIDVLVLTHSDKDHIGGAEAVTSSFRVKEIWRTTWVDLNASGVQTQTTLDTLPTRLVEAGESLSLPGLRWRIFWGDALYNKFSTRRDLEEGPNAHSIAMWGTGRSFGFFGAGDLNCTEELALPIGTLLNRIQILKVSHHGSKSSSCLDFLKKIRPETAIISSGKGNSYGHPHALPLENLAKMGVKSLRTDTLGSFSLEFEPNSPAFQIKTGVAPSKLLQKMTSF